MRTEMMQNAVASLESEMMNGVKAHCPFGTSQGKNESSEQHNEDEREKHMSGRKNER
jgi:hypothetical protein